MKQIAGLLDPLPGPTLALSNRVVMAPMNRRRALNGIPGPSMARYYAQRAGAGLIITDNTAISPNGIGYLDTPGIYNAAQQEAWRKVAEEIHARNGKVFMQLVHAGRIGHPVNHEDGTPLIAPSAIRAEGEIRTPGDIHLPMPQPEALTTAEVRVYIDMHIHAAVSAIEAGFDGVEIHGAHGYLVDQFLHPDSNHRTDRYGGSIVNRSRFLLEITEAVVAAIGAHRTGVRLSPFATVNDLGPYPEEEDTHRYIVDALQRLDIRYIHLSARPVNGVSSIPESYIRNLRKRFLNLVILAGGYTAESASAAIRSGLADLVAFGRPFISNPDLVERFRHDVPLASPDSETFYQGGDKGYIDYPALYQIA